MKDSLKNPWRNASKHFTRGIYEGYTRDITAETPCKFYRKIPVDFPTEILAIILGGISARTPGRIAEGMPGALLELLSNIIVIKSSFRRNLLNPG